MYTLSSGHRIIYIIRVTLNFAYIYKDTYVRLHSYTVAMATRLTHLLRIDVVSVGETHGLLSATIAHIGGRTTLAPRMD